MNKTISFKTFLTKIALAVIMLWLTADACLAQIPKPFVIPELKEWKAGKGYFRPAENMKITYEDSELQPIAQQLAKDYKLMFGTQPLVEKGKAGDGDVCLMLKADKKLGKEGYNMNIDKSVKISAPNPVGVYWATRSLLQMLETSTDMSIPKGDIRDWPDYADRGIVVDCGRKYIPLEYLRDLANILSYYKMNVLHVGLNNNGFKDHFNDDWDRTYSAFRLESDTYPGLAARDGYYTKDEFKDFQHEAMSRFVDIIPEIDVPAHSLAFSHYRPSLGSKEYGMDHLDLSNPEVYNFVDSLFNEYLEGEDPVFVGERVHIGTDEYSNKDKNVVEQFRAFTDHYIKHVESFGKKACVWGALTHASGDTPVKSDDVTMYAWYNGYAQPKDMVEQGYKLISIPDGLVYIVPIAGYYYDYLNTEHLYNNWTPANVGKETFEKNDPAILGGMFAVWNDVVGNGISVKDVHHRVFPALQTVAVKTWNTDPTVPYEVFDSNRKTLSEAPDVNQLGRVGNPNSMVFEVAELTPGQTMPFEEIGYDYTIEFEMDAVPEEPGTVLFSSPNARFYLSDPIKGMLGFSRDGYLNTFPFRAYPGEHMSVKITGDSKSTALYVNGKLVEDMVIEKRYLNDATKKDNNYIRTLVFPLEKAGDFKSKISNLKVYNYKR